jgi:hypothetical protein
MVQHRKQRDAQAIAESGSGSLSRLWFSKEEEWVARTGDSSVTNLKGSSKSFFAAEEEEEEIEEEEHNVAADDSIKKCQICGEGFDKFWDDNDQEWMFKYVQRCAITIVLLCKPCCLLLHH